MIGLLDCYGFDVGLHVTPRWMFRGGVHAAAKRNGLKPVASIYEHAGPSLISTADGIQA